MSFKKFLIISEIVATLIIFCIVIYSITQKEMLVVEPTNNNYIGVWKNKGIADVTVENNIYKIDYDNKYCKIKFDGDIYNLTLSDSEKYRFLRLYNLKREECVHNVYSLQNMVFKIKDINENKVELTPFNIEEVNSIIEKSDIKDDMKKNFKTLLLFLKKSNKIDEDKLKKAKMIFEKQIS